MIEDLAAVYGWSPTDLDAIEVAELAPWQAAARRLVTARRGRV